VLPGFIACSIADRPGVAPGLVGGMLAHNLGAGFLGGIASGFIAGYKSRFDAEEREAGGPALVLGAAFITEGAIPLAAKDPLRVIPALVLGCAVTGAISMLLVPHGGIFAVLIPGAVTNLLPYLAAIVTTTALFILKNPVATAA